MKTTFALLLAVGICIAGAGCTTMPAKKVKQTYSSFDLPSEHVPPDKPIGSGTINFQGVALDQVLAIYQKLSGRTVIRGNLPSVHIAVQSQTAMSRAETLQMFDNVLAQNGIAMVLSGDNVVKAVPVAQAVSESPPEITLPWQLLPESSSMMMRTVHLQHCKPSEGVPALMPLSKVPNSMVALDGAQTLILRDYSANIRQELKLLEELEKQMGRSGQRPTFQKRNAR